MSHKRSAQAKQLRQQNARHKCDVAGCTKPRRGFSYFCDLHAKHARYYGHPSARRVRKKDYAGEREHVVRFLRYHADHAAVVAAIKWAERWLKDAAANESVPAVQHMQRLAAAGVTGKDIVEEVLSLWLFSRWHPHSLADDIRLTKALGTAVLYLAPSGKRNKNARIGGQARQIVGEHIRNTPNVGIFVFHVLDAIEAQIKTRQDDMQDMRLPFSKCELAASSEPPEDSTQS